MRVGSLFSGYGGLDLAVMRLFPGSSVAWHCEYDEAPSKILAHHWPTVPNHRDVTQIDWDTMPPVDILTGGYPCQPFSAAGQRKGTDDERHLWPYVRDAIRHLRPRYTLLENVAGHRSLGFDRVLGDLAEDGMHVRWTSLRASDVGAPHHRDRLFILVTTPDTHRGERDRDERTQGWGTVGREAVAGDRPGLPSDSGSTTFGEPAGSASTEEARADKGNGSVDHRGERIDRDRRSPSLPSDTDRLRCGQGAGQPGTGEPEEPAIVSGVGPLFDWGPYAPVIRRWERLTRPAPAPTELNSNGKPRLSAEFASWMMGLPAGHVTDPAIGISRAHQLKAIGNGVCPQQAIAAYASILTERRIAA